MSTDKPTEDLGGIASALESGKALSPAGAARRRFTRNAGLGTTGVILTLVSQPGMAEAVCVSPSRQMSPGATTSLHPKVIVTCAGMGPSWWSKNTSWPCSKSATFGSAFPCNNASYSVTLLQNILTSSKTDSVSEFGRALVTTYLNVTSGKISFLTQEDVISMYTEMQSKFSYKPSATVPAWTMDELTQYLQSTCSNYAQVY